MKPLYLINFLLLSAGAATAQSYRIVDTNQVKSYDEKRQMDFPSKNEKFYGQDSQYLGYAPKYRNNKNGTVSDLNTGLMWTQDPGKKMSYADAVENAAKCRVGGHRDWRLPTIKELYSLIDFSGLDIDPNGSGGSRPFIDNNYFKFTYGDASKGERPIDSQFATSTIYKGKAMGANTTMFGVNFADGRIKGYPATSRRKTKLYYVLYVRGNKNYGKNKFVDNGNGTITDKATGLTWMQFDSKVGMPWEDALKYAENLKLAGKSDWRLPNIKELQSIVDYNRSPSATNSAALHPIFSISKIKGEDGKKAYPYFWSSTTHAREGRGSGSTACYIAFGKAYGWMSDRRSGDDKKTLMDVHGAGCQRSDPKSGDPADTPYGRGPQGDVLRIYNFVRCVRGGKVKKVRSEMVESKRPQINSHSTSTKSTSHFIKRLDKDGDGRVSKSEFDGPKRHFKDFDKNGDGYLSEEEAPQHPPKRRGK